MLSLCSPTTACSFYSQISFDIGLRPLSPLLKAINIEGRVVLRISNVTSRQEVSFRTQAAKFAYSHVSGKPELSGSLELANVTCYLDEVDERSGLTNEWSDSIGAINRSNFLGSRNLSYVESPTVSVQEDTLLTLPDLYTQSANLSPDPISTLNGTYVLDNTTAVSNSLVVSDDAVIKLTTDIQGFLSGVNASINASVSEGKHALENLRDDITSLITSIAKTITEATDNSVNDVQSSIDHTGKLTGNGLTGISGNLKEAASEAGHVAIDVLRKIIVVLEDNLASSTGFVIYYYKSAKELFPPEVQNILDLTEDKAVQFLVPVKATINEVNIAIKGFETYIGLDAGDPIIQFALFLGISTSLGISYWVLTYGGYSGDLSPSSTSELLMGEDSAVLIDVRPEGLKERDGIPDLRRGARFKYANVSLPEIGDSVKNLLVKRRDLEDSIVAAVIRNLKIVRGSSMVIVMDSDGSRSRGIARSLRKLGVKRTYLVQGGFVSWVKARLRVKDLRPETTLTILSEEAEAILEDIKPTPLTVAGYVMGFASALYALLEWEKTLQLIGVVGVGQTIYRRIASYEGSEDFMQDVRLLTTPVTLGTEAFSWAARKLEPNRIGLPTSPSSSAVQDRVLQAAAKHESQPPETEETPQDLSQKSLAPAVDESVDISDD